MAEPPRIRSFAVRNAVDDDRRILELEGLLAEEKRLRLRWELNYGELYARTEMLERELRKRRAFNRSRTNARQSVEALVRRGLKDFIRAHGENLSGGLLNSAAKRVAGQFEGHGRIDPDIRIGVLEAEVARLEAQLAGREVGDPLA